MAEECIVPGCRWSGYADTKKCHSHSLYGDTGIKQPPPDFTHDPKDYTTFAEVKALDPGEDELEGKNLEAFLAENWP